MARLNQRGILFFGPPGGVKMLVIFSICKVTATDDKKKVLDYAWLTTFDSLIL